MACHASGQSVEAVPLSGTVLDSTGAVVTGAAVDLKEDGTSHTTRTDLAGHFGFRASPGTYHLEVRAEGFEPYEVVQSIAAGQHSQAIRVVLSIRTVQQDVTVPSEAAESTASGANKSALRFKGEQLDVFSNDPAVMQAQLQALSGSDPGGSSAFYVDGFSSGAMPPKQNIREIRINENPFKAESSEFGRGRIDIFTKPGSSRWHGSADFNYGNSTLNARNPYTGPQPAYSNDYSVANLNGPLGRAATIFLSAQRSDLSQNAAVNAVTVDPATLALTTVSQPVPNEVVSQSYSARIDRQMGAEDTAIGRYTFSLVTQPYAGTGQLVLPSQGYKSAERDQTLQLTETHIFSPKLVLESGLQYIRGRLRQDPVSTATTVIVQGSFSGGGSPEQALHDNQDRLELRQAYTLDAGRHLLRAGIRYRLLREANLATAGTNGQFVFPDIGTYRNTLLDLQSGLSPQQIRAKGDGASQFSLTTGTPSVSLITGDLGVYTEDEWRAQTNLTLTYGLRVESQSAIPDHLDIGPRLGFAYALPTHKGSGSPLLTLRGGFGIFYKRFPASALLTSLRENGIRQQVTFCANPDFFPSLVPDAACLGAATAPTTYQVSPRLHTPVQMQGMFGLEHTFQKYGSIAATWYPRRQVHELDSLNLNAPLPGTGVRPYGGTQNVYAFASNGISKGQDLDFNGELNLGKRANLWTSYSINHDSTDTQGFDSFPSNSFHPGVDMGAYNDFSSQKLFAGLQANPGWGTALNLFIAVRSHSFFNITTGSDNNGDSIFNDRPAFATDLSRPSVVRTAFGIFDTNPLPEQTIIPINYGHAPAFRFIGLSLNKEVNLGPRSHEAKTAGPAVATTNAPGRPSRPYRLLLGISADNLLNTTNPGLPVGVLTSPFFGRSISLNVPFTGNTAANRAITLRTMFSF